MLSTARRTLSPPPEGSVPDSGVQAAAALAQRVEFAQKVLHFLRKPGQAASGRAVSEVRIDP